MTKIENAIRQLSLVFLGICIILSVIIITQAATDYNLKMAIKNYRIENETARIFAATLHDLNEIITNKKVSGQINDILTKRGYEGLVKEIINVTATKSKDSGVPEND